MLRRWARDKWEPREVTRTTTPSVGQRLGVSLGVCSAAPAFRCVQEANAATPPAPPNASGARARMAPASRRRAPTGLREAAARLKRGLQRLRLLAPLGPLTPAASRPVWPGRSTEWRRPAHANGRGWSLCCSVRTPPASCTPLASSGGPVRRYRTGGPYLLRAQPPACWVAASLSSPSPILFPRQLITHRI